MALLLITLGAFFLAGVAVSVFALLVVGIQLDTRRMKRVGLGDSRTGAASRRLLATVTRDKSVR